MNKTQSVITSSAMSERGPFKRGYLSDEQREMMARLLVEEGIEINGGGAIPRRSPDCELELSFAQQRLWLLDQLRPGNPAYNLIWTLRFSGPLNRRALEQSLNEIVRRHESLRTAFTTRDGRPVQMIAPAQPLHILEPDLSAIEVTERNDEAQRLVSESAQRPFDLSRGPLIWLALVKLSEEEYLFCLSMSHIISDGWSLVVLGDEIEKLYEAFSSGRASPLPELDIQYADFALWQRKWVEGESIASQIDYWKRKLHGAAEAMELPADYARPAVQSFRGHSLIITIEGLLAERLKILGRQEGATIFMTLLAAVKTLLYRLTGEADIVIGAPAAGRDRAEIEGLIGFFVNAMALRTDLSGGPTFRETLKRAQEVCLDAYANQDLPFEKLLEELQPERSLSRTPLFQVFFNMLNPAEGDFHLPGIAISGFPQPNIDAKFDLTFYAREQQGGIAIKLVYSSDLFEEPRMRELLEQLNYLLTQIADSPDKSVNDFSLRTRLAEKVLPDPFKTSHFVWTQAAHSTLSRRASLTPGHTAVKDAQETLTYRDLDQRSGRLANYLLAAGLKPEDLVIIYAHRSAALVWAIFGILKAGCAFVILDPAYPERRLIDSLRAVRPMGWFHVAAAGDLPPSLEAYVQNEPFCFRLKLHSWGATEIRPSASSGASPEEIPDRSRDLLEGFPVLDSHVAAGPDDLAYVAFTSGSTGEPKGVMGTHGSLTHHHIWLKKTFGIGEADRFSMLSGLSHDPLLRDVFTPLLLGATLCIPDPDFVGAPSRLVKWIAEEKITVANLTPAMAQLLDAAMPAGRPSLDHLLHAFFVGESLTRRDVAQFRNMAPNATCVNLYGTTESQRSLGYYIVPAKDDDYDAVVARKGVERKEVFPVGRGIEGVELLILNSSRNPAGVGELGEVYISSRRLARGYLNDASLTQERFLPNPFTRAPGDYLYKTGDRGRYLPDGNVEVTGRIDKQVNIRGFRVELGEVEAALRTHPNVRECAALLREDTPGDKRLVGYIAAENPSKSASEEIRAHLRMRLPSYMVPAALVFLEILPLTPNGKLDRRALPAPETATRQFDESFIAPRTPTEEEVAGIWRDALRLERISVEDNFFQLGGHSLLGMQMISRIGETLRIELPLRALFEASTIASLSERIEQVMAGARESRTPPIKPVPRSERLPLSIVQESGLLRMQWNQFLTLTAALAARSKLFHTVSSWLIGMVARTAHSRRRKGESQKAALSPRVNRNRQRIQSCVTALANLVLPEAARSAGSKRFHITFASKWKGPLNVTALEAALNEVVRRHEALRATLAIEDGHPVQRLRAASAFTLPLIVLERLGEAEQEAEARRIIVAASERTFDLAMGPLLRTLLLRLNPNEHIFCVVIHHIICDGVSLDIFNRELMALYESFSFGVPSPLAELTIQYADFAHWQREWLQGAVLEEMLSFWRGYLIGVGVVPELELPFAGPRPAVTRYRGATESLRLPDQLCERLKILAHQKRVTMFMLFLATLKAILHLYNRKEFIPVLTPFANRVRPETRSMIGWIEHTMCLNTRIGQRPRFSELLEQVREECLGAYQHQEIPYPLIGADLLLQRGNHKDLLRAPRIPSVFFDFQTRSPRRQPPGLVISPVDFQNTAATPGIAIRIIENAGKFHMRITYETDVYSAAGIRQMLAEFQSLLESVVANPDERIDSLQFTNPQMAKR